MITQNLVAELGPSQGSPDTRPIYSALEQAALPLPTCALGCHCACLAATHGRAGCPSVHRPLLLEACPDSFFCQVEAGRGLIRVPGIYPEFGGGGVCFH